MNPNQIKIRFTIHYFTRSRLHLHIQRFRKKSKSSVIPQKLRKTQNYFSSLAKLFIIALWLYGYTLINSLNPNQIKIRFTIHYLRDHAYTCTSNDFVKRVNQALYHKTTKTQNYFSSLAKLFIIALWLYGYTLINSLNPNQIKIRFTIHYFTRSRLHLHIQRFCKKSKSSVIPQKLR